MGAPVPADDLPQSLGRAVPADDLPQSLGSATPGSLEVAGPQDFPMKQSEPMMPYITDRLRHIPGNLLGLADLITSPIQAPYKYLMEKYAGVPISMNPVQEGVNRLSGVKETPVPRDETGKPKESARLLGALAEYGGGGLVGGGIGGLAGTANAVKRGMSLPALMNLMKGAGVGAAQGAGTGLGQGAWTFEGGRIGERVGGERGRMVGEAVSSLLGPMATKPVTRAAIAGIKKGKTYLQEKTGIGGGQDAAAKAGQSEAGQQLETAIKSHADSDVNVIQANDVAAKIPGVNWTTGRSTGAPGAIDLEKQVASRSPEAMAKAQAREAETNKAIGTFRNQSFPPAPPDIGPTAGTVRAFEAKRDQLDAGLKRLEAQERALAAKYQRGDIEAVGAQAHEVRGRLLGQAKAAAGARYNAAFAEADAAGLKVNVDDVKQLARSIRADEGRAFQGKPSVVDEIIDRYTKPTPPPGFKTTPTGAKIRVGGTIRPDTEPATVSLKEFQSLYIDLRREASRLAYESKINPSGESALQLRMVEKIRDKMSEKIGQMEQGPVGAKFKDANTFYRTQVADRFKRGVGGEMGVTNKFGVIRANEDANVFGAQVFKKGDSSGVKQYLAMVDGDKKGVETLNAAVMDIFAKAVTDPKTGLINETKLANFRRDYKEPLSQMPWLEKDISSVERAKRSMVRNRDLILERQRDKDRQTVRLVASRGKDNQPENYRTLKRVATAEDSRQGVTEVLNLALEKPTMMQTLVRNAKSPAERAALVRGLVDHLSSRSDAAAFIRANESALKPAFDALGPKHWENVTTLLDAEKIAGRVKAPTAIKVELPADPMEAATGSTFRRLNSIYNALAQGRGSKGDAAVVLAGGFLSKTMRENKWKALDAAVYDPQLAAAIIAQSKAPGKATNLNLSKALALHGITWAATATGRMNNPPPGYAPQKDAPPPIKG